MTLMELSVRVNHRAWFKFFELELGEVERGPLR